MRIIFAIYADDTNYTTSIKEISIYGSKWEAMEVEEEPSPVVIAV